jgi:hypothetical protein
MFSERHRTVVFATLAAFAGWALHRLARRRDL